MEDEDILYTFRDFIFIVYLLFDTLYKNSEVYKGGGAREGRFIRA